jgi:co-chaperonin GroES (HSP10)
MITPVRDLLYILPIEDPSLIGKIIIPDSVKKTADQGIVKYRGPDTSGRIRVGDHVLYSAWSGDELDGKVLNIEGEGKLVVIPEDGIDCILGDGDNALLPIPTIMLAVKRAAAEMMAHEKVDTKEAMHIDKIVQRLCSNLEKRFNDELIS